MKVKRSDRPIESSITSIEILTERVEDYFSRHSEFQSRQRFYPENPNRNCPQKACELDIILFGNAFKSIMNSGLWSAKKIRLWCLSSRFKNFLEKIFPGLEVNLIARNELFPPKQTFRKNDWSTPTDLVYGGRISAQKNIESLIYISYFLQQGNIPCTLHLVGDFDNHYHEHLGRRIHSNYQKKIQTLVDSLEWKTKPVFHGKTSSHEWLKLSFVDPVAISMSTFFCEDFGVSLAQATQEGWPVICSDFGGHADLTGDQIFKCDSIPHSHLPMKVIELMSKRLTQKLLKALLLPAPSSQAEPEKLHSLNFRPLQELDELRRSLSERLGTASSLIAHDELGQFADSSTGAVTIANIEAQLFSQAPTALIITYDCDALEFEASSEQELEKILNEIPDYFRIEMISSKNIFFKDQMSKIMNADLVYLNLKDDLKQKSSQALQQKLGITPKN